jgi:ferritin-like metal-binding protein YciE
MRNLNELLVHEIQDLYDAELQLVEALPKMSKKAQDDKLKAAFDSHLMETKEHARRLEKVAKMLGVKPDEVACKGMKGLIKEGEEVMKEGDEPEVIDAGLIGAAQKVEHYEIAAYGTARAHAQRLGLDDVVAILERNLEEESAANEKLTKIAESGVNQQALATADTRR